MDLKQLTDEEQIGLMALLKLTISADRTLSDAESQVVMRIADEIGRGTFAEVRRRAEQRLRTRDELRAAVAAVTRQPARQLLHALASEAAESDGLIPAESEILSWVAELWGLGADEG